MQEDYNNDLRQDESNEEVENNQSEQNQDSEKPITYSKKTVGVILFVALFIILMLVQVCRGCSISKEVTNPNQQNYSQVSDGSQTSITTESEVTSNGGEVNPENSEISSQSTVSVSPSPTEAITSKSVNSNVKTKESLPKEDLEEESEKIVSNDLSVVEVTEPSLGDSYSTSALVSNKTIYQVEGCSYAYSLSFLLITGSEEYSTVRYFCPKTSYDAVTKGDTVEIVYQVDKNGVISISSVSK